MAYSSENTGGQSGEGTEVKHTDKEYRENDFKQGGKSGGGDAEGKGEPPRKLEANNIMNTMEQVFQPPTGKVTDYIKKHDPQNSSGAAKQLLDFADKLLKKGTTEKLSSMTGMMGMSSLSDLQQATNQAQQTNQQQQQPNNQPCPVGTHFDHVLGRCLLDCPQGQKWDYVLNKCVIDDSATGQGANNNPSPSFTTIID